MIINFIQGFFMALADSVPGVSGGSIAFIMGFYDKFITSLNDLMHGTKEKRIKALKYLLKLGIGWVIGVILAVSILASVFDSGIYKVSSLFLGFILGAIPLIIISEKPVLKGKYINIIFTILGILLVILLTTLKFGANVSVESLNVWKGLYIIIAGMFAISAMVLPGISGSTILLTFGLYVSVISAAKDLLHLDFSGLLLLICFGIGVLLGVFLSLKGIKRLLEKHRSATIYGIIGMMIGSLYAIVMGPTNLKVPKEMLTFKTFNIPLFILGIIIVLGLEKIKSLSWYKKEDKNNEKIMAK